MTKPSPIVAGANEQAQDSAEMLAARQAALSLLHEVLDRHNPLDAALENDRSFAALPQRDRAFCRMIVSTTLRRLGQIDDLITKAEDKPANKNLTLQNILRIGVAQIMFMNVPDHAAVDTSVRLAEAAGMDKQKGFVNALLRNVTKSGREWLSRQDEGRLNTPEWLLKLWIEDYSLREAANIAKANLAEAPLDITIRDEKDRNHWSAVFKATQLASGSLRILKPGGLVQELPGFDEGAWWIQDAAAAMAATLLGDVKGKTVIDLCAAPGGKTVCFAISKPASAATDPPGRNRDASYLFVSTRPAERVRNEVSAIVGYPQKPSANASITIGTQSYAMYPQNDGAWIRNAAEEAKMVSAMRGGSDLVVRSESARGTKTTDTYSLKGISEALDKIAAECK